MNNKKRFSPNEHGLLVSKNLADKLGLPFDKEKTEHDTLALLDLTFRDISSVLDAETRNFQFENFASRDFAAFAEPSNSQPLIFMDQQFTLFFLSMNFLVCHRACVVLRDEAEQENLRLFNETLRTLANPYNHEAVREDFKPLFLNNPEVLVLANALTNCMIAFILCHEIAHHAQDHHSYPESSEQEFEADAIGFNYLSRISQHAHNLSIVKVSANKLGAPVLAMDYLHAAETLGISKPDQSIHPRAQQRAEKLMESYQTHATEEADYLLSGLRLSCKELTNQLDSI